MLRLSFARWTAALIGSVSPAESVFAAREEPGMTEIVLLLANFPTSSYNYYRGEREGRRGGREKRGRGGEGEEREGRGRRGGGRERKGREGGRKRE